MSKSKDPKNCLHQSKEEKNKIKGKSIKNKKIKLKKSSYKRLKKSPKKYHIYTIGYKKHILEEVNNIIINSNNIFQVKNNKNEKEVAKIYGINSKILHRWVTKGLKEYKGK